MADLIERGAAIDKMCGDCKSGYDGHCPHPQGMCHECESIWQTPKVDIPTANLWIPCSERQPKESGLYLTYQKELGRFQLMRYSPVPLQRNGTGWFDDNYGLYVTHWMPLPDLPKEVDDAGN